MGRAVHWITVDQLASVITNAGTNILLARALSIEDYGAFGVVWAGVYVGVAIHTAFFAEPFLVNAGRSGGLRSEAGGYVAAAHLLHWALGATMLGLAACMQLFGNSAQIVHLIIGFLTLAPVAWALQMSRRMAYGLNRERQAALASLGNLGLQLGLISILVRSSAGLSATSALVLIATASVPAYLLLLVWLRPAWRRRREGVSLMTTHWRYGRWVAAHYAARSSIGEVFFYVPIAFLGLAQIGQARAMLSLMSPIYRLFETLETVALARLGSAFGQPRAGRRVMGAAVGLSALYTVPAGLLLAVAVAGHQPVVLAIYGTQYEPVSRLLITAALMPVAGAIGAGPRIALKGLRQTRRLFTTILPSLVLSLLLSFLLPQVYGPGGILGGLAVVTAVGSVFAWVILVAHVGSSQCLQPRASRSSDAVNRGPKAETAQRDAPRRTAPEEAETSDT